MRCHGDAAPPRGLGRELAAPSGCAPRLRSDQALGPGGCLAPRRDLTPYTAPRTVGPRRRVFDTNRRLWVGGVGSAAMVPFGPRSRGPAISSLGAACRSPGSQRRGAPPSGLGKELEREDQRRSARERSPPIAHNPRLPSNPAAQLPVPALCAGDGVRTLSLAPGWDAQPRPEGRVH